MKKLLFALLTLATAHGTFALDRPCIWAGAEDKARLRKVIAESGWAAGRLDDMKQNMAPHLERHKASPPDFLKKTVPEIPAEVNAHGKPLNLALEAGVLYFMTENDDYAQLAADILNVYVQHLGVDGHEVVISTSGPERDYWDLFPMVGLTYDFIHPYLTRGGRTVFDKLSGKRIPFDDAKAQVMFERVVETGFEAWIEGSNHTIHEGAGILYCALSIKDKQKRDAHIRTFLNGSRPMTGLYWMKQSFLENNGVWPESVGYSGAGEVIYILMDVMDRVYPGLGILNGCEKLLPGLSDRLFYTYPGNAENVCFGDSHRGRTGHPGIPASAIRFVRRAGLEKKAKALLCHIKADREQYGESSKVSHNSRGGNWAYNEFLTMDLLEGYEPKRIESQAVVLPYAGVVIQNNLHGADKKEHGLMYYTGGAEYVHSHLSGLDFEIFGAGYVMSGVGGLYSPRDAAIFNDYYRSYAGHNTVVVNGKSRGGSEGFWGQQKMLYMNTTRMESLEPKPYAPAVSKDFTFSSQILNDKVNKATQQRMVSIVRTSETSGYYFDLFRSRSEAENEHHDYIYHNIGDSFSLHHADETALALNKTDDRYQSYPVTRYRVNQDEKTTIHRYISPNDKGGRYTESLTLRFPGWHYFSGVMSSAPDEQSIHGTFFMKALGRYNHVAMPGGFAREYTAAKAPPVFDAVKPYAAIAVKGKEEKSMAQVLSVRQPGEAWDRPFIVIYEPSANEKPTVQHVENILFEGKVIGARVVSQVDGKLITDLIIARDRAGETYKDPDSRLSFTGRFAIIRTVTDSSGRKIELYIGDGKELTFQGHKLVAKDGKAYETLTRSW